MDIKALQKFISHITEGTGQIVKKHYRQEYNIELKGDNSPVTIADKSIEEFLTKEIQKEFPTHSILGEEFGSIKNKSNYEWVIDPIDGTKSFISGVPLFSTIIALLKDKKPILGIYYNAILGDLLIGDNSICLHNGRVVRMRSCPSLSDALILTTDHFNVGKFQNQERFDTLVKECKMYRTWADAYGYFLLATGFADIIIDPIMSRWDTMALIPIINGAGGVITDYEGQDPVEGCSIIAAAPEIHHLVLNKLSKNKN